MEDAVNLKSKNINLALKVVEVKNDNGYYHIFARPVTIGSLPDRGHRASDFVDSIDSYDLIDGLHLNGLEVKSQGGNTDAERRLYGFEVVYRHVCEVDRREAARYHKTLSAIDRKMERLSDKFGAPATFGQFVARVAVAIGAKQFVFVNEGENARRGEFQFLDLKTGVYKIDQIVDTWASANKAVA
jgi:hypothetical protein